MYFCNFCGSVVKLADLHPAKLSSNSCSHSYESLVAAGRASSQKLLPWRGEQLKWSLAFRLYIESFPCAQLPGPVHTARLGRMCFCVHSLGLCFVCPFVLLDLFLCPYSFMFPWAVESSPLQFLALA